MSDLELTKACAEAMGLRWDGVSNLKCWNENSRTNWVYDGNVGFRFDPLNDDAQVMALLKKFSIQIHHHGFAGATASLVTVQGRMKLDDVPTKICANNLNRAICECVAKMVKP